jgi:hypothetical protein
MEYKGYIYDFSINPLVEPIGKTFYFTANLGVMGKKTDKGIQKLECEIKEVWGKTKEDASTRMHEVLKEWIDKRS